MSEAENKPLISISIIGHVDSGKSTLTGMLATRFGELNKRDLEKLNKIAAENNKSSFSFAYFTDRLKEERERGVTIQTTLVKMSTSKFSINFLDCPGHADYIKNATSGCKQSDLSIVVVPANFQASCSDDGTLKTHLTLAAILGSKNFIVCINKIDELAGKSENDMSTTFEAASAAVYKILKRLGVKKESVFFLPISALNGTGIFKDGEKFEWFKGSKPTPLKKGYPADYTCFSLEEAIDYQDAPERPIDSPLRLPISNIAQVSGHGSIYCGRVDYGIIKPGDNIKFQPANVAAQVKNVQAFKKDVPQGIAGMNIGFSVICKDKAIEKVSTGHIVGPADDNDFKLYPFYVASCMSLKRKSKSSDENKGIKAGYTPVLSCGTANVATKFAHLIQSTTKDGVTIEKPDMVPKDAQFKVVLYPTKPVLLESATKYKLLGKLVCRDSGELVACGQIVDQLTKERAEAEFGLKLEDFDGSKAAAAKKPAPKKK